VTWAVAVDRLAALDKTLETGVRAQAEH